MRKDVCRLVSCKYDDMNEIYKLLLVWGRVIKIDSVGNNTQQAACGMKISSMFKTKNYFDLKNLNKFILF